MHVRNKICIQNFNLKFDGKETLWRARPSWNENITTDLKKIFVVETGLIRRKFRTSGGQLIIWCGTFWFQKRRKAFFTEIRQQKETSWIARATALDGSHFLPILLLTSSTL
jgi:hypothetical protein